MVTNWRLIVEEDLRLDKLDLHYHQLATVYLSEGINQLFFP